MRTTCVPTVLNTGRRVSGSYNHPLQVCKPQHTQSALQQIDWLAHVVYAEVFCQRRIFFGDGFVHSVGHVAIGGVSGGGGAQLGDVDGFGEVHLEERALAERSEEHTSELQSPMYLA